MTQASVFYIRNSINLKQSPNIDHFIVTIASSPTRIGLFYNNTSSLPHLQGVSTMDNPNTVCLQGSIDISIQSMPFDYSCPGSRVYQCIDASRDSKIPYSAYYVPTTCIPIATSRSVSRIPLVEVYTNVILSF